MNKDSPISFPESLVWGAATSSTQIEGAWDQGGRGPSIWDRFCQAPGHVLGGDTPFRACDFYHRWREDIAIMKTIGLQAFRFSISWSRVLPDGTGAVNETGLDFYSQLVDGLLEAGIQPYVTLYHWDLPEALHQSGGWTNREIADWFADYAAVVAGRLGDRVRNWVTFNEPQIFLTFGYGDGTHAPGLKLSPIELMVAAHHVNLAHGRAVPRLRELVSDSSVGFAIATKIGIPAHESDPNCVEAARLATVQPKWTGDHESFLHNSWWPHPMIHGRYPEELERRIPGFLDLLPETDLSEIQQPLDFFGYNYYFGMIVEPDEETGWREIPARYGEPRTMMDWPVHPSGLYWASRFFHEEYKLPLCIFENGLSSMDWVSLDGEIRDDARIDFLTRHLQQLYQAIAEGILIDSYFHWSLLDNFEWSRGYRERFGLVYVDFETMERTPKQSATWFGEVIRSRGISLNGI